MLPSLSLCYSKPVTVYLDSVAQTGREPVDDCIHDIWPVVTTDAINLEGWSTDPAEDDEFLSWDEMQNIDMEDWVTPEEYAYDALHDY